MVEDRSVMVIKL